MTEQVTAITAAEDGVGESPVWRAEEGKLYWVDIPGRRVRAWHAASGRLEQWSTEEMVACIAFDRRGGIVAAMQTGFFHLTLGADGKAQAKALAQPTLPMPGMRFNDGRCDRQGRFWAGTMHTDMPAAHAVGELYCLAGRNLRGPLLPGLIVQNGLAWSPNGRTMYLSDSHPTVRKVWAFDYNVEEGLPSNRRIFLDLASQKGRPDGAAVDVDGCYWMCANDGAQVQRFTPDGRLDLAIDVPVSKPAMCAFGGDDLRTLFITSIPSPDPAVRAREALGGAVFAVRTTAQGLPEPEFVGG